MSSRRWVFTLHLPSMGEVAIEETARDLIARLESTGKVRYTVFQAEMAPTTGKLHLQGYAELTSPFKMPGFKKLLGSAAHCEAARGTPQQCKDYCTKTETRVSGPWEWGTMSKGQGARTDLEALVEMAKEGKSVRECYDVLGVAAIKFNKYYDVARRELAPAALRENVQVIVHWGDSGTGKTYDAMRAVEGENYFIKEAGPWWDGYQGETHVILDEFQGGFMTRNQLLRLLDVHPVRVEIKGGVVHFAGRVIYITSNFHPNSWYVNFPDPTPIMRRITQIVHYQRVGDRVIKTVEATGWVPPVFTVPAPFVPPHLDATSQGHSGALAHPAPAAAGQAFPQELADVEVPQEPEGGW